MNYAARCHRERSASLPTARRIQTQPSAKTMCSYGLRCSCTSTGTQNKKNYCVKSKTQLCCDHSLLHQLQPHMCPIRRVHYLPPCRTPKSDRRHTSNFEHCNAWVCGHDKVCYRWVKKDYKHILLLTSIAESLRWVLSTFLLSPYR